MDFLKSNFTPGRENVKSVERAAAFSWDDSARRLLDVAEEAVALRARRPEL